MFGGISGTGGFYGGYSVFGARGGYNSFSYGSRTSKDSDFSTRIMNSYTTSVKDTASMLSSLKELSAASRSLQQYGSNVWDQSKAVSSDEKVLTASTDGKKTSQTYNVEVTNIAKAQEEKSTQLSSKDLTEIAAGKQSISIQTGGKSYNLSVDVTSKDTNKDVMSKVAEAINKSNSGLTAKVVTENDKSQLVVTGKTGEANGFALNSQSISQMNITKTQIAENAKYSVGGKDYTSASNSVKIGNGSVTATLKSVGTAKISSVTDSTGIVKSISQFADKFNDARKNLNKMADSYQTSRVNSAMSVSIYNRTQFGKIGVTFDSKGEMNINEKTLASAVEKDPDRVKRLFSDLGRQTQTAFSIAQTNKADIKRQNYNVNFLSSSSNSSTGLLFDYFS